MRELVIKKVQVKCTTCGKVIPEGNMGYKLSSVEFLCESCMDAALEKMKDEYMVEVDAEMMEEME